MGAILNVGEIYQLYTKYETIAGEKVMVVGTLAYSETPKVPYNLTVLAINERVIAVSDEDLQERIKGDTIYHCRSIYQKPDGSYAEYVVWDSIINREKTIRIDKTYRYEIKLSIPNTVNSPITQIIGDIEKYVAAVHPGLLFSIAPIEESSGGEESGNPESSKEDILNKSLAVLEMFNKLENKLVPAADVIINSDLINKTNKIVDNFDVINANIQYIADSI
jgi:hypothetical protein